MILDSFSTVPRYENRIINEMYYERNDHNMFDYIITKLLG